MKLTGLITILLIAILSLVTPAQACVRTYFGWHLREGGPGGDGGVIRGQISDNLVRVCWFNAKHNYDNLELNCLPGFRGVLHWGNLRRPWTVSYWTPDGFYQFALKRRLKTPNDEWWNANVYGCRADLPLND